MGRDKMRINIRSNIKYSAFTPIPDSLSEDTTAITAIGDTIYTRIDGADSIFVLYDDTIIAETDSIVDSNETELRLYNATKDIKINVGGYSKSVSGNLYGVAIEDIFGTGHIPEGDAYNTQAWDWISDLCPQSIRFPGGASDRFMHLLPYRDVEEPVEALDSIKGYGYDIYEIIRYFDVTDGAKDILDAGMIDDILSDMAPDKILDDWSWMFDVDGSQVYKKQFEEFYKKWSDQQALATSPIQSYINQFIHLIRKIQAENPGHTVNVIVDLNILSESAPQCKKIVQYLRDHGVTVAGVELGNEVYFDWGDLMMGFTTFADYWSYINGGATSVSYTTNNLDDYAWPDALKQSDGAAVNIGHNYIKALKTDPSFDVKIGLPAENLPYGENYAFRTGPDYLRIADNWNSDLSATTIYQQTALAGVTTRPAFDAIVIHPYYEADWNWEDILLNNLCLKYPSDGFPSCNYLALCTSPVGSDNWKYNTYDERLRAAFEGFLGSQVTSPFGNVKQLIRNRYKESYDVQRNEFEFIPTAIYQKELWTTEWNLKDTHASLTPEKQDVVSIMTNSFPHGLLVQEWLLKDMKMNFDPGYCENFHTYAMIHALGAGAPRCLLYHADDGDFVNSIPPLDPDDYTGHNLWLRRTTYWNFLLLSEITKHNLQYVPSTFAEYALNPNIQPTVFIDQISSTLYVYFSNMKGEVQNYVVNPNNLITLFPGAVALGFVDADINAIKVDQPYWNAGRSSLYTIHTCYNTTDNLHPFKIQGITEHITNMAECTDGLPSGAICVGVPQYTVGYFTLPIHVVYPPHWKENDGQFAEYVKLYPNPACNAFKIHSDRLGLFAEGLKEVVIYSFTGNQLISTRAEEDSDIDISTLPSGIYFVNITDSLHHAITKSLIKSN